MRQDPTDAWPSGAPQVGHAAEMTRLVTSRDIELFSELTGDFNPIHYDPAKAERTRFGEIVVQGGVTTGILNAIVAERLPGPGTVFLETRLSFHAPVRPGDEITGRVTVTAVRKDKPITELDATVHRGDGTRVLSGELVCYTMSLD